MRMFCVVSIVFCAFMVSMRRPTRCLYGHIAHRVESRPELIPTGVVCLGHDSTKPTLWERFSGEGYWVCASGHEFVVGSWRR